MNMQEAAAELNGNEYGEEGSSILFANMKAAGLVAVFGASDDLTEFRGAIDDEAGAGDVTEHLLTKDGILYSDCENDRCPYFAKLLKAVPVAVKAEWDCNGYSWFLSTTLPHATFDVMEDGERYCRGLVLSVADLPLTPTGGADA